MGEEYGYMLIEYCQHGDLSFYVSEHVTENYGLSVHDIMLIFGQIVQICLKLKKNHFVHRDLKKENILVSNVNPFVQLKLCDFETARTDDVVMMSAVGTPETAQINRLKGQKYDSTSDLFSLGTILYSLLFIKYPAQMADATTWEEIIDMLDEDRIPLPFDEKKIEYHDIHRMISTLLGMTETTVTWEWFENDEFIKKCISLYEEERIKAFKN